MCLEEKYIFYWFTTCFNSGNKEQLKLNIKIGPQCVLVWAFIHDTCINFSTKRNFRPGTTFGNNKPWFHLFCLEILCW